MTPIKTAPTTRFALAAAAFSVTISLAGCGGGSGTGSSTPPPTGGQGGTTNRAPSISGTPATTAKISLPYYFQPTASDPDGDRLTFQITGKPGWASFNTSSGALSGTPGDAATGTYSGIQITVTDGTYQASLPAFTITVSPPVIGSATLNWQAPTQNEDGTPLTDLAGYVVRYSKNPGNLDQTLTLTNPSATSAVINNLIEGTWFFTLSSVNASGFESRPTGTVSKIIG